MNNRLLINPGTPQAWQIELKPGLNRIGRGESNDFTINHPSISTHHCEITVTDTTITLRDLGSTNGTFVERVPVSVFQLHNGQHVQFGSVDMMFDTDMAPALPSPAANMPGTGAKIVLANPGPSAPPPPPPPPPVGGLRINKTAQAAPSPVPSALAEPPTTSRPAGRPMSRPQPKTHEEFAAEREKTDRKMFVNGVVGAICGGLLGMFGWYLLIMMLHMEIGYAAIMVGAVTGAGARLLARQGSSLQGIVCAVCALFAIIGGQYFALVSIVDKHVAYELGKDYKRELKWAKSAVEATNETDVLIFLSVRDDVNQSSISPEDIKTFQEKELPAYRDLVNGKPTKEEYVIREQARIPRPRVVDSIGIFTIVWSLFGIAAAWRIGSGNEG